MYVMPLEPLEYRSLQESENKPRALSSPYIKDSLKVLYSCPGSNGGGSGRPREVGTTDQYLGEAAKNLRRIRLGPALRKPFPQRPSYLHEAPPCCEVGRSQFGTSQSYGRHAGQPQHAHRNVMG